MKKICIWVSIIALVGSFKNNGFAFAAVIADHQVESFTLINASNEQAIQTISAGQVINLASLPSRNLNIRANTNPAVVGSLKFVLSGQQSRSVVENMGPYALFGDSNGNYNNWTPQVGSYTLTATPYSSANGAGTAGTPLTISFSVTDQGTQAQYNLTLNTAGSGTVHKNPDQTSYPEGSTVALTATPAAGNVFSGWSGDASGTANPLSVLMNGNKNITAHFTTAPAGQQVVGFTLINASNEQAIQTISPGQEINLANLPSRSLNIRADTNPATVGSVRFALTGTVNRNLVESAAPYALYGDYGGNYTSWLMPVGTYTLTATPYTGGGGGGTAGTALTISFTVIDQEGDNPPELSLTRGPYLQMASQSAVTLRWRTSKASDTKLEAGTEYGNYTHAAADPALTTEHEIRISGLKAGTRYYYRFGSTSQVLQSGADNYFYTAPAAGNPDKVRIAVLGDCGRNVNNVQTKTLQAYLHHAGANPAELLLLLGDNAYASGTDAEYQSEFFNAYSNSLLRNHVLFPTPGNHDYYSSSQASRSGPYYKIFTLPTNGESGGLASGTEAYYSYDWGDIHFISLDSYGTESPDNSRLYDTLGAQVTWLKQDLAANTKPWVIVYWHHPPYSMGSHNTDTEAELVLIRQNFIRILERNGVDLVLTGHSHNYERSYLLRNHYGKESSFDASVHAASTSSGKYNGSAGSCPYVTVNGKTLHGTVYVVSGSAGAVGGTQSAWPHNAMPFSDNGGGMLYLEVEQNRLDAKYLRTDGTVWDQFSIMKEVNKTSEISAAAGSATQLTASWVGTYQWSTGETSRSITVSPGSSTVYQVTDNQGCLTDVFRVNVVAPAFAADYSGAEKPSLAGRHLVPSIYPTWVRRGTPITVQAPAQGPWLAQVFDINGRLVYRSAIVGKAALATAQLPLGMYVIHLQGKHAVATQKVVVTE